MSLQVKVNVDKIIDEVLDIEAQAILDLKTKIKEQINESMDLIINCNGRVVVTGIGKSGLIGKKIAATFASTGTPSFFMHPAEGLHGDLGMVTKNDIVLAISNSGETVEVLKIIPSIKRIGAKIIALVGNSNSTLAEKSDVVISYGAVHEACPLGLAPTTSATVTLVIGDVLAVALLKARNFKPENFALFHPGGSLGRKLLLTVADIADESGKNPIAHYKSEMKDVLFEMTEFGLGAISIVDDAGVLIGILTDGDIRRALVKGYHLLDNPISGLYNENPIFVQEDILAAEALRIMEDHKINVLPIVDENKKPKAMIHIQDLIKMGL
ncbi:KpsF/GutQ family sugar-phosphate isomerase [Thermolongibacillus altinsuensis]